MGYNQSTLVKDVVAYQAVEVIRGRFAKFGRLMFELLQRFRQPMRNLHIASTQGARELDVMVSGDAVRSPGRD